MKTFVLAALISALLLPLAIANAPSLVLLLRDPAAVGWVGQSGRGE